MIEAERRIREALSRPTLIEREDVRALLAELDRLTRERDEHARWRAELADKLHATESLVSELRAERDALRTALTFYAKQEHFILSDDRAWDTVSGEGENWWCDEAGTATVEDGSIAKGALTGEQWAADVLAQIEQERSEQKEGR